MNLNHTHLILLTISVITAGQLNENSWLSMLLRFIGIECDFVSKQWLNLIALIKGLIAHERSYITLIVLTTVWKIFAPQVMNAYT